MAKDKNKKSEVQEEVINTTKLVNTILDRVIKEKGSTAKKGKNLFLISYDKHNSPVHNEIIRKRVLTFILLGKSFIHKEPVETTILFSSNESYIDIIKSAKKSPFIKNLYQVLVEITPPDMEELHILGDPKLTTGLAKNISAVKKLIKENDVSIIEKLLQLPESRNLLKK